MNRENTAAKMGEGVLKVYLAIGDIVMVPYNDSTTAEDICIQICKQLNIGPVARHIFALRTHSKHIFLRPSNKFVEKAQDLDFRIRFKPASLHRLKKIDVKAYDYYFHQVRTDVLDNKVLGLDFELNRKELVGLGITDMYRVMLEKDIPRDVVENDYKKYIPKEVIKRHAFFLKKPIHDMLGKIKKSGHDAWYVKHEYLKQFDIMVPEYLAEEYKADTEKDGSISNIIVRVEPPSSETPIKYCFDSKKENWHVVCTFEDLMYISMRDDYTVEISRKNSIPFYLKFKNLNYMYAFVSLLDGYYRLAVKWIFNICKDILTPSLQRLHGMRCHGPVGGEFSYAKLEAKRANKFGCFIIRESEVKYNMYYIDLCVKDNPKPKTFKFEKISNDEYIFNDDFKVYKSIQELIAAYNDASGPEGSIYLGECLPSTEYDQSPLLLCRNISITGDSLTDGAIINESCLGSAAIINTKDLQMYQGQKREGYSGITYVYRGMWKVTKGKKVEVAIKLLKDEYCDAYYKEFCELAGQWALLQSLSIVKMYGITFTKHLAIISEYVKLGPLNKYLSANRPIIKSVDLLEAASNLASALWHLEEHGYIHGNIRCKNIFVSRHDDRSFTVKLGDPGIKTPYSSNEVHWIPIECYSKLEMTKRSSSADVWAFATTLWEIFTYAEPIPMDHNQAMKFYKSGQRLPKPPTCPDDVYQIMKECWDADPNRRKKPQAIIRDISQIFYEVYDSRRSHSYARILPKTEIAYSASTSTASLSSNNTESTSIGCLEELSINNMIDFNESFGNIQDNQFICTGFNSDEDRGSISDFPAMTFDFMTISNSLDSINQPQTVFELDHNCDVTLDGRIGQGHYGEVYKGFLTYIQNDRPSRQVAVKKLKRSVDNSNYQNFNREIEIMKMLKHENIVEILGVFEEPNIMLIMEFVPHGSLESYLKIYKDRLQTRQLLNYAFDISQGMEYLGKKNIVHRDLAARNILVVDDYHVKISDFGLAQVMEKNYYILKTNRDLPMKWYALESLTNLKFSSKSDVWSFGVTLFEMFSRGEEPNLPKFDKAAPEGEGLEQQQIIAALEAGQRLPCPNLCPQSVYVRILYPCWDKDPHIRPTFTHLGHVIDEMRQLEIDS